MDKRSILYIEADEEIPSVISKIKSQANDRVTLVVPKASIILQSIINLKLLMRAVKSDGKSISIVSHDIIGRNLASQVGLPIYESVNDSKPLEKIENTSPSNQEVVKITKDKTSKPPSSVRINHFQKVEDENNDSDKAISAAPIVGPTNIGNSNSNDSSLIENKKTPKKLKKKIILSLVTLLILIIGFVLYYPQTNVSVAVMAEDYSDTVDVTVDTSQKEPDFESLVIPGENISSTQKEKQEFESSGEKNVGEKAEGKINFYNSWSTEPQSFESGTKLSRNDKSFLLKQNITIPGATISLKEGQIVTNPGQTSGNIVAEEAGEEYNVSAGTFSFASLSGERESKIYGKSDNSLSGGTSEKVSVVTQSDIDNGKQTLEEKLEKSAREEILSTDSDKRILDQAIVIDSIEVAANAKPGDEKNKFTVEGEIVVSTIVFNAEDSRQAIIERTNTKISSDKQLLNNSESDIKTDFENIDLSDGTMSLTGIINSKIGPRFDEKELKLQISGKKTDIAEESISSLDQVESVEISPKPNWLMGRVSLFTSRINIDTNYKE